MPSLCQCKFINNPVAFWDSPVNKGHLLVPAAGAKLFANHSSLSAVAWRRRLPSSGRGCCLCGGLVSHMRGRTDSNPLPVDSCSASSHVDSNTWPHVTSWVEEANNNGQGRQNLGTTLREAYHHTSVTSGQVCCVYTPSVSLREISFKMSKKFASIVWSVHFPRQHEIITLQGVIAILSYCQCYGIYFKIIGLHF